MKRRKMIRRNPVAKAMRLLLSAQVYRDRKALAKRGYSKHKQHTKEIE
jgi:hypothetical protein